MSSFFPTPRHAEDRSSAACRFCLLAVLCAGLTGVLAIFPVLLIVDCDGNLESGVLPQPLPVLCLDATAGGMGRAGTGHEARVTSQVETATAPAPASI